MYHYAKNHSGNKHVTKNKKRGGNPPEVKKRKITDISSEDVKLEFLSIESLTDAYVNAINEWKEAEKENNREKLLRLSRGTLFTLLVLLGILAYSEPSIIRGLTGNELQNAIDTEMRRLVSEGISFNNLGEAIKEFTLNVSQIRFTFKNGDPLTASQIINIFKQNNTLSPIIETLERSLNIITGSFNEIKGLSSSAFRLLENISTGQISRQNIGDIAGYGMWSIIIYIGMIFTTSAYSTATGIASMINKISANLTPQDNTFSDFMPTNISQQSLTTPLLLTIDNNKRVVTLGDILYTINNRPKGNINYINSVFDAILTFIFNHEEQWTLDNEDNLSVSSMKTEYTTKTIESLSKISDDGYGDEFRRMANFINDNFSTQINDAVVVLGENLTLIYGSLFKIVCGRTGLESNESSQLSQDSNISEITEFTNDDECQLVDNNTIKQKIEKSLANTLMNDLDKLSSDKEIIDAAQGLLSLHLTETSGGKKYKYKYKKNKTYKTKKIRKHSNKKKINIKKNNTHKRGKK
jgi:hypothetical protein